MNPELIYLASPYSHIHPHIMDRRHAAVCKAAANFLVSGHTIYSPIAHMHPIQEIAELPTDWDFWERFDTIMLQRCQRVWVLQIPGWDQSKGVAAEIAIAIGLGLPVEYVMPTADVIAELNLMPQTLNTFFDLDDSVQNSRVTVSKETLDSLEARPQLAAEDAIRLAGLLQSVQQIANTGSHFLNYEEMNFTDRIIELLNKVAENGA